jgi:hypothetical protein
VSGSPLILNNKICLNDGDGIYSSSATPPDIKVNWIYANDTGIEFASASSVATVLNNTIADNYMAGIFVSSGNEPNINSCIIWGHDGNDLVSCSATYSCIEDSNDANGAGNFSTDPLFVDSNNYDYYLRAYSPCAFRGDPNADRKGLKDICGHTMVRYSALSGVKSAEALEEDPSPFGDQMGRICGNGSHFPVIRYVNCNARWRPLVAHWEMDKDPSTTGNRIEDSEGANDYGIAYGSPGWTSNGRVRGALIFDGVDDYVDFGEYLYPKPTRGFTLALWIKRDTSYLGQRQGLMGDMYDTTGTQWGCRIYIGDDNRLKCDFEDVKDVTGTTQIADDDWHFVAATYDVEDGARLYLNGIEDGSGESWLQLLHGGKDPMVLGCMLDVDGNPEDYFHGKIDHVMFAERALTGEEILVLKSELEYRYGGDGKSWLTAFKYIQSALDTSKPEGDVEIWVAKGTYYPDHSVAWPEGMGSGEQAFREATFRVHQEKVSLYGGFAGVEEPQIVLDAADTVPPIDIIDIIWQPEWRHIEENKTILSGDIGTPDDYSDNCHHVVTVDPSGGTPITDKTVLDGFIIQGGNANVTGASATQSCGGGIYCCYEASPTISNCKIEGNRAQTGAGMYIYNASPRLENCGFSENEAQSYGGGVFHYYSSNATFIDCVFKKNTAQHAGGLDNVNNSFPKLVNCVFSENTAEKRAGAIRCYGGTSMEATNCVFSENETTQSYGGAVVTCPGCSVTLTNCTFSNNVAAADGGGVFSWNDSPTIRNCIFWGNSDAGPKDESEQVHVQNGTPDVRYSCIEDEEDDEDVPFGGKNSPYYNTDDNPEFVDADDANGPDGLFGTLDDGLALCTDSPCVDKGNDEAVPDDNFDLDKDDKKDEEVPYDASGARRIKDSDHKVTSPDADYPTVDMGAYEVPRICYVDHDNTGQKDGKTWGTAFARLESALDQVHSIDYDEGDEIWVAEATYTPYEKPYFRVEVPDLRVYGGFDGTEEARNDRDWELHETTLSGGGEKHHVLVIRRPGYWEDKNATHDVVVDGFTITGGNALNEDREDRRYGGGIWVWGRHPWVEGETGYHDYMYNITVANCTFRDNKATVGGGLANYWARVNVNNCSFIDNEAKWNGGGMCNTAAIVNVRNCIFAKNKATGTNMVDGAGGGMYNEPDFGASMIANCTFTGNQADFGGAMFNMPYTHTHHPDPVPSNWNSEHFFLCFPQVKNTIFWGNAATNAGGEIYNYVEELSSLYYFATGLFGYNTVQLGLNATKCGGFMSVDMQNAMACPYFVDPDNEDYRLQDYSPCIDLGDPDSDHSREDQSGTDANPRINLGAYGNTVKAKLKGLDDNKDELPDAWVAIHWPGGSDDDDPGDNPDKDGIISGWPVWAGGELGLINYYEWLWGTDPTDDDSDGDWVDPGLHRRPAIGCLA